MPNTDPRPVHAHHQAQADPPDLAHCPAQWRQPVAGDQAQPCGANLEYHTDYAVLLSELNPKVQVQYGDFTVEPEPPDWGAIERQARALSQRTRDITVLCALTRARTRRAGAVGLREGLAVLHAQLHSWPEHVHPQRRVDGQDDPQVRANALAALADPQGLLADIRAVAISTSAAAPLTVKDVERALGPQTSAYPGTGPDAASVRAQLRQLQKKQNPHLLALQHSAHLVKQIDRWSGQHLQQDAPDLSALLRLLAHLLQYDQSAVKVQAEAVDEVTKGEATIGAMTDSEPGTASTVHHHPAFSTELGLAAQGAGSNPHPHLDALATPSAVHSPSSPASGPVPSAAQQREHIRALLGQVIGWIEVNEPSSPVSIVLRQAQNLWGKRYAEIVAAVPPELLAQWDAQLNNQEGKP